ncbi:hypothetical protein [Mucilaginibacter gracilis]|nr:hypothetical protein [Mucilaginibacter gracilis]
MSLLSKYAFGVFLISSALISCKKGNEQPQKSNSAYGKISYFAAASVAGAKTGVSIKPATGITTMAIVDSTVAVNWASASVYVEKVEFVGQSNRLLDTTITVEKNLNIFNAGALAGIFQLPVGSYKNVSVKMFCKKSLKSEMAFNLKGLFTNTSGGKDSVLVGSSFPFVANLAVTDIVIDPSDNYKVTFNFDLSKVLTGITNRLLQTAHAYVGADSKRTYVIWKGGSAEEPFFDQVISNWQTVASVVVTKDTSGN